MWTGYFQNKQRKVAPVIEVITLDSSMTSKVYKSSVVVPKHGQASHFGNCL